MLEDVSPIKKNISHFRNTGEKDSEEMIAVSVLMLNSLSLFGISTYLVTTFVNHLIYFINVQVQFKVAYGQLLCLKPNTMSVVHSGPFPLMEWFKQV